MSDKPKDLREEIRRLKYATGLRQKIYCTQKENKMYKKMKKSNEPFPEEVHADKYVEDTYYKIYHSDLTEEEMVEYIQLKQLESFQAIKRIEIYVGVVFFVFVTIILVFVLGLIGG